MRASRGEIKIEEILKEAELNFKMEYIFPDLRSPNGRPLRFDFVVFDDDGKSRLRGARRSLTETFYRSHEGFTQRAKKRRQRGA